MNFKTSLKSALVTSLLSAALGIAGYIVSVADVFKLNFHALINVGVFALLTPLISLLKSLLTQTDGTALGIRIK